MRVLLLTLLAAAALALPASAPATAALPSPVACPGCWHPSTHARWQYQLQASPGFDATGGIDVGVSSPPKRGGAAVHPTVWDIDLYVDPKLEGNPTTPNTAAVDAIHARGGHAICYVSAGSWENWRGDADSFPASVKGKTNGWPGERWLDIRRIGILAPIMERRVAACAHAGFDAVEWDNVDAYTNDTGFPLTARDQLAYNVRLANMAHAHGLSVGLKNDISQLAALKPYFDFAVNEQCFAFHECARYDGWTKSGRPVVEIEYEGNTAHLCAAANAKHRDAMRKALALKATPWTPCR